MRDENIFIFDYPFDINLLTQVMWDQVDKFEAYSDPKHGVNDAFYRLIHHFPYADQLNEEFGINSTSRFYHLLAGRELEFHQDYGPTCSINVILADDHTVAPITFEKGMKTYHYRAAVLNVQNSHGVFNNTDDRYLFRMSIFDESFESVCDKVAARLLTLG